MIFQRISFIVILLLAGSAWADAPKYGVGEAYKEKEDWYTSEPGKLALANILGFQNPDGGFPKNYDPRKPRSEAKLEWNGRSTIDNGATWTEARILSRAHRITKEAAYRDAATRAIEFLIKNQYPNGGWAQQFPIPTNGYSKAITYNDNAMASVLRLVRDVSAGAGDFAYAPEALKQASQKSFDRGVQCVLGTQIRVDGKLTAWCQQHDEKTLLPVKARAFEPAATCSSESASILQLLMEIKNPSPEVRAAIEGGAHWFEISKITGKKIENFTGANGKPDRKLVDDPSAPPLWARLYDLKTNKPVIGNADGKVYDNWDDITQERRIGYAWYGAWGEKVLANYAEWKKRNG